MTNGIALSHFPMSQSPFERVSASVSGPLTSGRRRRCLNPLLNGSVLRSVWVVLVAPLAQGLNPLLNGSVLRSCHVLGRWLRGPVSIPF